MLDAVQDHVLVVTEDDVAVLSHKLHDQLLALQVTQLIQMFDVKFQDPLQTRLADGHDPSVLQVLAKQHTEAGGA